MTRLIPAALYSERVARLHQVRETSYPTNLEDSEGIWERAANRIDAIDPEGREAYAVLKHLKELDRYGAWSNASAQRTAAK